MSEPIFSNCYCLICREKTPNRDETVIEIEGTKQPYYSLVCLCDVCGVGKAKRASGSEMRVFFSEESKEEPISGRIRTFERSFRIRKRRRAYNPFFNEEEEVKEVKKREGGS